MDNKEKEIKYRTEDEKLLYYVAQGTVVFTLLLFIIPEVGLLLPMEANEWLVNALPMMFLFYPALLLAFLPVLGYRLNSVILSLLGTGIFLAINIWFCIKIIFDDFPIPITSTAICIIFSIIMLVMEIKALNIKLNTIEKQTNDDKKSIEK